MLGGKGLSQNGIVTLRNGLGDSNEVKHTLALWPSSPTVGIYSREMKTRSRKTLFMDVQNNLTCGSQSWKQASYPSTGEWIKKLLYIHAMEY